MSVHCADKAAGGQHCVGARRRDTRPCSHTTQATAPDTTRRFGFFIRGVSCAATVYRTLYLQLFSVRSPRARASPRGRDPVLVWARRGFCDSKGRSAGRRWVFRFPLTGTVGYDYCIKGGFGPTIGHLAESMISRFPCCEAAVRSAIRVANARKSHGQVRLHRLSNTHPSPTHIPNTAQHPHSEAPDPDQ
eukprot:7388803-Prymnesium_polylepis.1